MQKQELFSYSWYIDNKEQENTSIRIYGLNSHDETICLRIDNFTPYVYIELPEHINWNGINAQLLANKIDELLRENKPLKK